MIVLNARAGLCNRLRAINSAIRLASECNLSLLVYWILGHDMNVKYTSLFEPTALFDVRECSSLSLFTKFLFSRYNPRMWKMEDVQAFVAKCKSKPFLPCFYSTCYDFYHNEDYTWLKPTIRIRRLIDGLRHLSEGAMGVHIRRTDNLHCLRYSPVELFYDRIAHDIDSDRNAKFFLCTDDNDVKRRMIAKFGDHIRTRENISARNDVNGVADAVVDLFLLADTRKIYGSYPSTFSHVAAQIGGRPLEFLRTEEAEYAPYLKD